MAFFLVKHVVVERRMQLVTGASGLVVNSQHSQEMCEELQTLRIKHSILNQGPAAQRHTLQALPLVSWFLFYWYFSHIFLVPDAQLSSLANITVNSIC